MPRIVAGAWRGRRLAAPAGTTTRPTADRVRQALFDMLLHAGWAGRTTLVGAAVLDVFAGSGAYGLEALSRGAARATFFERDRAALAALRANVTACGSEARCRMIAGDALAPPPGTPHDLLFLDPPYGSGLIDEAIAMLRGQNWIAAGALIVAELSGDDVSPPVELLADRRHGKARLIVWRSE